MPVSHLNVFIAKRRISFPGDSDVPWFRSCCGRFYWAPWGQQVSVFWLSYSTSLSRRWMSSCPPRLPFPSFSWFFGLLSKSFWFTHEPGSSLLPKRPLEPPPSWQGPLMEGQSSDDQHHSWDPPACAEPDPCLAAGCPEASCQGWLWLLSVCSASVGRLHCLRSLPPSQGRGS